MNENMRFNFVDDSDKTLISKIFWKHVKSRTRISDSVCYGNKFWSDSTEQATILMDTFPINFLVIASIILIKLRGQMEFMVNFLKTVLYFLTLLLVIAVSLLTKNWHLWLQFSKTIRVTKIS